MLLSSVEERAAVQERREKEYVYLENCRREYQQLWNRGEWDPDFDRSFVVGYANDKYAEGFRTLKILSGSFAEFLGYLQFEYGFSKWWTHGYYKLGSRWGQAFWLRHPGVEFRERMAFRQHGIEKKVRSEDEETQQAWREHKHMKRDKSKHRGHRSWKARPFGKDLVHRRNRRFAKRGIKAERYDEVTQNVQEVIRMWWD